MSKIKTALGVVKNFENWNTFFADKFGLIKRKYILYKMRNGVRYKARSGQVDKNIINETWLYRVYTPKGFEIKSDDIIIDVGAHIGAFSIFASKHAKNGKVFAFEPVPENFEMLKDNTSLNKSENLVLLNKAVAEKNGKASIFLNERNTGRHSLYSKRASPEAIKIETITLDKFLDDKKIKSVDFLKMDCEGAEYQILFKASKRTLQKIKKISMEYHNLDDKNNVHTLKVFLEKEGFKVGLRGGSYSMLYAKR